MEKIVSKITLNISGKNAFQALVAKQYDNGTRIIEAAITDNGVPVPIQASDTIIANYRRPKYSTDKNQGDYIRAVGGTVVDGDSGIVQVPLDYWAVERSGELCADISIVSAGGSPARLTTAAFTVTVFPATHYESEGLESNQSYDALLDILSGVVEYKRDITNTMQGAMDTMLANETQRESEYATLKARMQSVVNDAEGSARAAATSESNAARSEQAAGASERNAAQSESNVREAISDFTGWVNTAKTSIEESELNAENSARSAAADKQATESAVSSFTTYLSEQRDYIDGCVRSSAQSATNAESSATTVAQCADSARADAGSATSARNEINATVGEFSAHMASVKESIEESELNAEGYKDAASQSATAAQGSAESAQTSANFASDTAGEIDATVTAFRTWVGEQETIIAADKASADQSKTAAETSATTAAQFADSARISAETATSARQETEAAVGDFTAYLAGEKTAIEASEANAASSASAAAGSAGNAQTSAESASASASSASQSATNAEASASSAASQKTELETSLAAFTEWFNEEKHKMGGSVVTIIDDQEINIGSLYSQYGTGIYLWEFDGNKRFVGCNKYAPLEVKSKSCYLFVFGMNEQQVGWYLFDTYEEILFNDVPIPEGFTYGFYNLADGTGTFITDFGVTLYNISSDLQGLMEARRYLVQISDMNNALETKLDKSDQSKVVYINDESGEPATVPYSQAAEAGTIAQRDDNGRIAVGAPTSDGHAANKGYVDTVAAGKLSNADIVNGETFVDFYKTVTFKTTVNLDAYPTEAMHAANKQYVDDRIGDIAALLDAINGEVI